LRIAAGGNQSLPVKEEQFRTFTRELKRLRAWLLNCRVTEIVMESTGQYWRPVWNILEEAFSAMVLVNPSPSPKQNTRKMFCQPALFCKCGGWPKFSGRAD